MKALEPLEVIRSNNGRSYAYQTRLGWCIDEPISNMIGKDSIGCHRLAVQDAINSKITDHQFVVEESIIDISLAYSGRMDDSLAGRTWYVPHHGVYHPSKPRKIRVVFDCSAQCSVLSQELLTGPDLTNLIVGVLIRFRQREVAFMADIESMCYQVRVLQFQQSFIKFLWWENHNIEQELSDFAMCAHVFG